MKMNYIQANGYQSLQVDSPFFVGPDRLWRFGLNNSVFGPYRSRDEAVRMFQAEQLITRGIR